MVKNSQTIRRQQLTVEKKALHLHIFLPTFSSGKLNYPDILNQIQTDVTLTKLLWELDRQLF